MLQETDPKIQSWLAGAQAIIDQYFAKNGFSWTEKLSIIEGQRYFRVVIDSRSQRSAFAFIDRLNGDVLKCAGWKAPAKHARGNVFDETNGLQFVTPHGMAHLR